MILCEVAGVAPHDGVRWLIVPKCRLRCWQHKLRPNRFYEIDLPPSRRDIASRLSCGGNSDQAVASFVHRQSVSDFQSVSIGTAILRAVATAALRNPRHPERRTAHDLSAENRFACRITQEAASNSPCIAASPHFETRPDQSISPD
jgi:hypothetical protein